MWSRTAYVTLMPSTPLTGTLGGDKLLDTRRRRRHKVNVFIGEESRAHVPCIGHLWKFGFHARQMSGQHMQQPCRGRVVLERPRISVVAVRQHLVVRSDLPHAQSSMLHQVPADGTAGCQVSGGAADPHRRQPAEVQAERAGGSGETAPPLSNRAYR